jgi:hypothetical protein
MQPAVPAGWLRSPVAASAVAVTTSRAKVASASAISFGRANRFAYSDEPYVSPMGVLLLITDRTPDTSAVKTPHHDGVLEVSKPRLRVLKRAIGVSFLTGCRGALFHSSLPSVERH